MFRWHHASVFLFAIIFVMICTTFLDYGITWDEPARKEYGYRVLLWYTSFFQNNAATIDTVRNMYGGFFEAFAQFVSSILVLLKKNYLYETRHLLNAFFGLTGIVFTYKLGRLIAGEKAGFFSSLILTLTPRYYGHIFNNSKDIPFAVLFLTASYYIFSSYRQFPKLSKTHVIKLGVCIGLALGVRIGALLLYGYFFLIFLAWLLNKTYIERESVISLSYDTKAFSNFGFSFFFVIAISWGTMLLCWPWAQIAPIENPLRALSEISEFPWKGTILFKGEFIKASDVPWDYIPTWLSISLPEFYFLFVLFGVIGACRYLRRTPQRDDHSSRFLTEISLLIFAIIFPVLYVIYKQSVLYDGIRHFLFILPFLAIISGISLTYILRSINSFFTKFSVIAVTIFLFGLSVFDMISLHPYENVYFNRIFGGGLPVAANNYDTDYWGNSYKEASEWVVQNYSLNSKTTYSVAACLFPQEILLYYLNPSAYIKKEIRKIRLIFHIEGIHRKTPRKNLTQQNQFIVKEVNNSDIIMAYRRLNCHKMVTGFLQHKIIRKGTPLAYVFGPFQPQN